jgi:hypothetical protein
MKIKENLILIILSVAIGTYVYFKIKSWVAWFKYKKISRNLYNDVLSDLKNLSGGINGLS